MERVETETLHRGLDHSVSVTVVQVASSGVTVRSSRRGSRRCGYLGDNFMKCVTEPRQAIR